MEGTGAGIKVEGNEYEVAQEYNKYFNNLPGNLLAEKGMNEINEIFDKSEEVPLLDITTDNGRKYPTKLASLEIIVENIERAILRLKNKKSSGRDGVSSNMVKQTQSFSQNYLLLYSIDRWHKEYIQKNLRKR